MFVISPRWGTSLEDHFFLVRSQAGVVWSRDFYFFFLEGERQEEGWGWNFWEISGRKEDENRGFSVPCGIIPRCAEWETGMQNDRERSQTDSSTSSSSGVNKMWETCCCFVLYAATHNLSRGSKRKKGWKYCSCNPSHLDLRLVGHPVWWNRVQKWPT